MRDLSGVDFSLNSEIPPIAIHNELQTVLRQLVAAGRRPRTIQTYEISFKQFIKACNIEYVADSDVNLLYGLLESLDGLALSMKLARLKAVKAVMLRFFENGWINLIFWRSVDVKVDKKIQSMSNNLRYHYYKKTPQVSKLLVQVVWYGKFLSFNLR